MGYESPGITPLATVQGQSQVLLYPQGDDESRPSRPARKGPARIERDVSTSCSWSLETFTRVIMVCPGYPL